MKELDLLTEALNRTDPAERATFLDGACAGNSELRRRLEELLATYADSGSPLARPAVAAAGSAATADLPTPIATGAHRPERATEAFAQTNPDATMAAASAVPTLRVARVPTGEGIGTVVAGRYTLVEVIGEGGMGSVYLASQTEPVKRQVALKLIKTGMDSRGVLARFDAERQALALMDHPNIARIYDGGVTTAGRPFFVMELVKGVPLTKYCDRQRLPVNARLGLFVAVCQAVQHAHQKGIIHRDLKPGNVLVTEVDGRPTPKVIDFGVAKATEQNLTDMSFSDTGAIVGTPSYMSPEQADPSSMDIDTRTDIYALGVMLYELLTGSPPLEAKDFQRGAILEMLRMVQEVDPPRPSTKLSAADALPNIAANRSIEPATLVKLLRRELDWVVMKCLEKHRDRRYETANGLAQDIQRYLADEPVEARPPSTGYRLRKFVRRNKIQVVAASLVLLALLAGMFGTTMGLIRATKAESVAEKRFEEAEIARAKAAASAIAEAKERLKAEDAEAATLADYRASTDDAIEQLISSKSALGPKERTYLENTLKRWEEFARRTGDDERSRAIRGEGHFRVARLWDRLGQTEKARVENQVALDIRQRLVEQFPDKPKYQSDLASSHNILGVRLAVLGKRAEAQPEFQTACDLRKKLVEQFPDVADYRKELADSHTNLAHLLGELGRREEARAEFQKALDLFNKLVEQFPDVLQYHHDQAGTRNLLGNVLERLGKLAEAQAEREAARDIQQRLADRFPDTPMYRQFLAITKSNLGGLLALLRKYEGARVECESARDIQRKLVEQFPAVPEYKQDLARTQGVFAKALMFSGKPEEALAEFQAARDAEKKLVEQHPDVPEYRQGLAGTQNNLAILLRQLGKGEQSRVEYREAIDNQKKLVEKFPAVAQYQTDLGCSYNNYGYKMSGEGKFTESLEWFDLGIRTLKSVHDQNPQDPMNNEFLWNCLIGRARSYDRLQKFAEAVKDWDRAIELMPPAGRPRLRADRAISQIQAGMVAEVEAELAELSKSPNWNADQWYNFACAYAEASAKNAGKKPEYADRAIELLRKAVHAGWKDAAHMAKDTDLDPLRGREDFKKLMAEFEKKPAAKPKK